MSCRGSGAGFPSIATRRCARAKRATSRAPRGLLRLRGRVALLQRRPRPFSAAAAAGSDGRGRARVFDRLDMEGRQPGLSLSSVPSARRRR